MSDRPILFSAPMVLALLREARQPGTGKTQTRRILKPQPEFFDLPIYEGRGVGRVGHPNELWPFRCTGAPDERDFQCWARRAVPPFSIGDRLWVKEAWSHDAESTEVLRAAVEDAYCDHSHGPYYRATEPAPETIRWRSSLFMPRFASRLTLLVTDVRVERLNGISEADATAEGVQPICDHGVGNQHLHRIAFEQLWCSLHGETAWILNPWVVAVSFSVRARNIDRLAPAGAAEVSHG